ncbi:MAG: DUF3617 domain-containing protein [Sphingobium sp.]|nr:DUF3617 domain-containing protein [Sphingobium sp.]
MCPVPAFGPALPLALVAAFALPLAACNPGPSVSATNASQAEVSQKVAAATAANGGADRMVEPGRWEGAMTIHEMDIPGMPEQVKAQMKQQMGGAKSFVSCVTEEDVKAQKAFHTGDDKNCKYDHFTLSGGHIDAAMSCATPEGGKMAMTMTGNYSPESYHLDMASKAEGKGPMGAMAMKMSVEAKRVGACRGTKDEH